MSLLKGDDHPNNVDNMVVGDSEDMIDPLTNNGQSMDNLEK